MSASSRTDTTPRLLIVDDEPHIRTVMRLTLEGHGHSVVEAGSGEEALDMFTSGQRWDAVLLDERMPGMDGLETLRHMRAHDPNAVVIMVTAFASIELAVDAMKLGATDFMRKPMTPDTLRAAVDGALRKARGAEAGTAAIPATAATAASAAEEAAAAIAPSHDGERGVAAEARPYEVWMFNGVRLRHVPTAGDAATVQRFNVRRGEDNDSETVVVEFTESVTAAAAAEAGHPLDDDQAFWIRQAALALGQYVWNHDESPAGGRLLVSRAQGALISAARLKR